MTRSAAESVLFIGTGIGNKSTPTQARSPRLQLARSPLSSFLQPLPAPLPPPRSFTMREDARTAIVRIREREAPTSGAC